MSATGQPIHIALTFNDAFWAPAYATMRSVCLSTRRRKEVVFHLYHWQLAADNRAELDAIAAEFGATILHTDLGADPAIKSLLASLPATKAFPPVVYARLLLDQLLPSDVARVLYLDCDVYVRAPAENLFDIDLEGKTLAAAPEPGRHHLVRGNDMRTRMTPFDPADPYFNSGVLLIDRGRWGAADLPRYLAGLVQSGAIHDLYHDQDVLNLRFLGDVKLLDPRWNLTKPHPALRSLDPFIVHYTTGMKPWNSLAYVAFGSSYKHVMTAAVRKRYAAYRRKKWLRSLFGKR